MCLVYTYRAYSAMAPAVWQPCPSQRLSMQRNPPPTLTCTLSPPVLARPAFLAVPARPALNRSGLLSSPCSHTHAVNAVSQLQLGQQVRWCQNGGAVVVFCSS
jgi:hypothetical protein